MPKPVPAGHPDYRPEDCAKMARHYHDYRPPAAVAQRCPAGHRTFKITAGGVLPPLVTCRTCAAVNRTATAYERGALSARPA